MRSDRTSGAAGVMIFVLCAAAASVGQVVRSIDLTEISPRTALRRPPSTTKAASHLSETEEEFPCSDPIHDSTPVIRISLVSLDNTHYQIADRPIFEIAIENEGSVPARIPISPHLTDLQSQAPGKRFDYVELDILLMVVADEPWRADPSGTVSLYGVDDHPGSMLTLNPAESIRVRGRGHFLAAKDGGMPPAEIDHMVAEAFLHRVQALVTSTATAKVLREVCMQKRNGQGLPISITQGEQ